MDAELAEFDAATTQSVNSTTFGVRGGGGFGPGRHGGPGGRGGPDGEPLISAAASVTGLTAQEVITQLQAGQSLAQIAQANGKTANDVIQAARAQLVTQLAQAVTDGRLTQAQSDANAATIVNDATFGQHGPHHAEPDADDAATPAPTGTTF